MSTVYLFETACCRQISSNLIQLNIYFRSSVHHKTAPSGGVHGFPDPNYFTNCHGELDGLNVPSPRDLDNEGKKISG